MLVSPRVGWASITARHALAAHAVALVALATASSAAHAGAPEPAVVAGCDGPRAATAIAPGGDRFAQTFAPRSRGLLTSAEVDVTKPAGSSGDWRVEVVLAERIPIGTNARAVVAAATVPDATVPVGASTIAARFPDPATIGPPGFRNEYELVISRHGAGGFGVGYRTGSGCDGQLFRSGSQTGPFSPFIGSGTDLVFRVLATDAAAPQTEIVGGPRRRTARRRAKFRWRASEPAEFECRLDRGRFEPCDPPDRVRVGPGRHRFRVRAIDLAGNVDPTPARRTWRVRR
jgi:hypothetical protein